MWGNPDITIDPDNTVPYILHVCPWKRGIFKGKKIVNKILLTTILENLHDEKKFTIYLYFLFLINDPEGNLVFYLSH